MSERNRRFEVPVPPRGAHARRGIVAVLDAAEPIVEKVRELSALPLPAEDREEVLPNVLELLGRVVVAAWGADPDPIKKAKEDFGVACLMQQIADGEVPERILLPLIDGGDAA